MPTNREQPPTATAAPAMAWWLRLPASLPLPLLYAKGALIAWLLRVVVRFRLDTVRANLRRCFPDMPAREFRDTVARHYREMTQSALEMFKLASFSADELRARVHLVNDEVLRAELAAGHNVMLLSAHQGNWEWVLQRLALDFAPALLCAYKPVSNERLDRDLLALRSRFGAQMVPAKNLLRSLLRQRQPHMAILAADQMPHSSPTRVWLPFMGQNTAFYPGPGEIAARYHYAAFFVAMRRDAPGHYEAEFQLVAAADAAIDAATFTARYAALVEAHLRAAPYDWAWGHRRWKLAPPST